MMQEMVAGERGQRKATTKMGENITGGDISQQCGGGQASISQRYLGSDFLKRICSLLEELTPLIQ